MRIRAELAGAQAALGATSTGSAVSTVGAETRAMISAVSVAGLGRRVDRRAGGEGNEAAVERTEDGRGA